jgi:hypothetical protein
MAHILILYKGDIAAAANALGSKGESESYVHFKYLKEYMEKHELEAIKVVV